MRRKVQLQMISNRHQDVEQVDSILNVLST